MASNSIKLVERVVEGVLAAHEAGNPLPVDIHLLHVTISFNEADERLTKEFVSFINKRLHPFLQLLPSNCSWHVHILALRRPILFSANDEEMMVSYALCRKAVRLNCSELLIKGKGSDPKLLPYLVGHTITHLVLSWSCVPVHLYHPKLGFRLNAPRGNVPRGTDATFWRASMTPEVQAPVVDGTLVEQPNGSMAAVYVVPAASSTSVERASVLC